MIEIILLGMLYTGCPMTSYDLKKQMAQSIEFFQSNSLGSIQPGLKKLEQLGCLMLTEKKENGRQKKYYNITEAGRIYFDHAFRQPFGPDKIRCHQLVKVFFFDRMNPEERQESIERYLIEIRGNLEALRAVEAQCNQSCSLVEKPGAITEAMVFQMDTLQFGLDYYQFMEAWFDRYKNTLTHREQEAVR